MRKKILGILIIGLVFSLTIPIGSAHADYQSKLFVIGVIQIDSFNNEIRGFALFAINDGEILILKNINIKYDGATPIQVSGVVPFFVHHIKYNGAL